MKKFLVTLMFVCAALHGEWRPAFIEKGDSFSALSNCEFHSLKLKVLNYLNNSWCSKEKAEMLMDLMILEKPKVCVEIGVFQGASLLPVVAVLQFMNSGTIYAIDSWSNAEASKNLLENDPNKNWWQSINMKAIYRDFDSTLKKWSSESFCIVLKMSSKEAVSLIPTIDFLHIDGNYSTDGSLEDVNLYLPKVKKGGYILFSSINWCVNGTLPRVPAFQSLLNSCEIIARIDDGSSFLVRKL